MPDFRLGNVVDLPSIALLAASPAWRTFEKRQEQITGICGECTHHDYCRGGCPYNVLAVYGGFESELLDPYCPAYKHTFDAITERALAEVFSQENMEEVVNERLSNKLGLLRKGKLIQLMRH